MKKIHHLTNLTNAVDLRQLFRKGQKLESEFFRLLSRENFKGYGRFVFVTPRSLDKRSTVRNRLRRRAREWIRKNIPLAKSNDTAVFFKKEAITAPKSKFYEELAKIFTQLGC